MQMRLSIPAIKNLDNITHKLENDCNVALHWFTDNFMKLNADKISSSGSSLETL